QIDDRAPYIYRTTDFGTTWTRIVNGIRADDYTHSVREDLKKPGLLYAGAEHGIWVSFDAGDHWQSLSLNLPDVQVSDIALTGNDVVIGTHGRSAYVLANITPLRELSASLARAPVHLFTPPLVTRNVTDATFQYHLGRPADSVRIELLDAKGQLIRAINGAPGDTAIKPVPATTPGCDMNRPSDPRAPVKAGLNTVTWNMRYPGAAVFDCMILWSANAVSGPIAPPGKYQVRISANGVTQTKSFTVRRDPRLIGVTDADLREQFALASRINEKTDAANKAVIRIRAIRDQLHERFASSKRSEVQQELRKMAPELDRIEQALYQVRNRSGQDPLNFPIRLNNRLAALRRSVETGDARPTAAAYVVFRELSAELDRYLAALARLEATDVARFNRNAAMWGVKPISAGATGE
ncbi:MAG TPA: glycosyl hydrolase, partial [Gemmatimonadaceae bacterium]|nr:glycosyl hydrolase [Gemmatimonadaceae bacterium]